MAIVEAWAIFAGVVAGGAVVLLAVATLARTAVPGTNPAVATAVGLDLTSATVAIALLGGALFAVIAGMPPSSRAPPRRRAWPRGAA